MRRLLVPTIVLAGIGFVAGGIYRYFADDPGEATLANYLRSSLHGMGVALSGWAVHLYFTSRSSGWVTKWPLVIELFVPKYSSTSLKTVLCDRRDTRIDVQPRDRQSCRSRSCR
jgi:hypothetical protein